MPEERKIRWSADGDWRIGEVEIVNEQGVVVAKLTGRVSHAAIVDICCQMCEQLARQAPAGVDVGAWIDIHGPAQGDLQRYVMETELEKSIVNQVARRGWVVEPPWLGEWNADVVARAYRLIHGAQNGDPIATTQLDRIRTGAMKGNAPCIEALAKFSAVGRMIAKGMSLDAVFAALHVPTEVGAPLPMFRGRAPAPARPPKKAPPAPPPRRWTSAPPAQTVKKPTSLPTRTSSTSVATRILTSKSAPPATSPSTSSRRGMGWPSTPTAPTTSPSPSFTRSIETRTFVPRAYTPSTAATLVTAAPIAQPYAQAYATQPYATQPYAQQPSATQPYQPQYQYPPMDSSGGGGGGGGGEEFPMDDLGDLEDSGDFNDLDDLSDPIPPPEGDDGWDEEEARAGANASTPEDDLAREPPPDDGSGERPFAAAPGGGGGAEAGGAMPDGTPESGDEVNNVTDGSDGGGMGVEMVPDMGSDDIYPGEGTKF